jgi:hypothetical protein
VENAPDGEMNELLTETYNGFLARHVAPRLKELGFRRTGVNFWRPPTPPETNWIVLNFQSSTDDDARRFVVSFGIMSPVLLRSESWWRGAPPQPGKLPKRNQAQLTWRLVKGWKERSEYSVESWWELSPAMTAHSLAEMASEVVKTIVDDGLPRVAGLTSDTGLRDYYLRQVDDPEALFAPIDLDYVITLLDAVGPRDQIDAVRARGAAAIARSDAVRSDFFWRIAPHIGQIAGEYLEWSGGMAPRADADD